MLAMLFCPPKIVKNNVSLFETLISISILNYDIEMKNKLLYQIASRRVWFYLRLPLLSWPLQRYAEIGGVVDLASCT